MAWGAVRRGRLAAAGAQGTRRRGRLRILALDETGTGEKGESLRRETADMGARVASRTDHTVHAVDREGTAGRAGGFGSVPEEPIKGPG